MYCVFQFNILLNNKQIYVVMYKNTKGHDNITTNTHAVDIGRFLSEMLHSVQEGV